MAHSLQPRRIHREYRSEQEHAQEQEHKHKRVLQLSSSHDSNGGINMTHSPNGNSGSQTNVPPPYTMKTPQNNRGMSKHPDESHNGVKHAAIVTASTPMHKSMSVMGSGNRSHGEINSNSKSSLRRKAKDKFDGSSDGTPLARRIFASPDSNSTCHSHYREHNGSSSNSRRYNHGNSNQDHRHYLEYTPEYHHSQVRTSDYQRKSSSAPPSNALRHRNLFPSPRNDFLHKDEYLDNERHSEQQQQQQQHHDMNRSRSRDYEKENMQMRFNNRNRTEYSKTNPSLVPDRRHPHFPTSPGYSRYSRDYHSRQPLSYKQDCSDLQSQGSPGHNHNNNNHNNNNNTRDSHFVPTRRGSIGSIGRIRSFSLDFTHDNARQPNNTNRNDNEADMKIHAKESSEDKMNGNGKSKGIASNSIPDANSSDTGKARDFVSPMSRSDSNEAPTDGNRMNSKAYYGDSSSDRPIEMDVEDPEHRSIRHYHRRLNRHPQSSPYHNIEEYDDHPYSSNVSSSPPRSGGTMHPYRVRPRQMGLHPAHDRSYPQEMSTYSSSMEDKENIGYRKRYRTMVLTSPSPFKYQKQHSPNQSSYTYAHPPAFFNRPDHDQGLATSPIERDLDRDREYSSAAFYTDHHPRYRYGMDDYEQHHRYPHVEDKYYHPRQHPYYHEVDYERYPQEEFDYYHQHYQHPFYPHSHSKHPQHQFHQDYPPKSFALQSNLDEDEKSEFHRHPKESLNSRVGEGVYANTTITSTADSSPSQSSPPSSLSSSLSNESKKRKTDGKTGNSAVSQRKRKKMYSDYVGVTYNKTHAKFQACITHYRKQHYLGRYKLAVDAAKAYDESARLLKGKGWKINFKTDEDYEIAKKKEMEKIEKLDPAKVGESTELTETIEANEKPTEEVVESTNIENVIVENLKENSEMIKENNDSDPTNTSQSPPCNKASPSSNVSELEQKSELTFGNETLITAQDAKENQMTGLPNNDAKDAKSAPTTCVTPLRTVSNDELSSNDDALVAESKSRKSEEDEVHEDVRVKDEEVVKREVHLSKINSDSCDKEGLEPETDIPSTKVPYSKEITNSKSDVDHKLPEEETKKDESSKGPAKKKSPESNSNTSSNILDPSENSGVNSTSAEQSTSTSAQPETSVLQNGTLEAASALMTLIRRSQN